MRLVKKGSSNTSRASLIAKLVSWFDGYIALYTTDPTRIDRVLRNYGGTGIDQIWRSVRKDVDKIVNLPEKSSDIEKVTRRASRARIASMIIAGITFLFLFVVLYYQNTIKNSAGSNVILLAPAIAIGVLYVALMVSMFSTRKLNRSMRDFYNEHEKELSKQTAHIREATQLLIDRLSREISSQNLAPERFKFLVYNQNYRNVSVVGKRGEKFTLIIKPKGQK